MKKLLELLKDGNSRTPEELARELETTRDDVLRQMDFLEHAGVIRKVPFMNESNGCSTCASCSGCEGGCAAECKGCVPQNAKMNMGTMWEVV
ncbi:MAG: Lrp/AsnC family transcriptional regulator [Lachnospiraceae bacterium]|nr:Lrp/AsnC family transcriptional regulator [Lachnospiraceae bacterium]